MTFGILYLGRTKYQETEYRIDGTFVRIPRSEVEQAWKERREQAKDEFERQLAEHEQIVQRFISTAEIRNVETRRDASGRRVARHIVDEVRIGNTVVQVPSGTGINHVRDQALKKHPIPESPKAEDFPEARSVDVRTWTAHLITEAGQEEITFPVDASWTDGFPMLFARQQLNRLESMGW